MSDDTYWTGDPYELLRAGPGFRLADQPTDATPGFKGGKADREKALDAGCDDYDTKPIDFPRLLGKIEVLLNRPAAS